MKDRDDWYGFIYPKSHDRFERPKTIGAHISANARFMVDDIGIWYFKTAYGIQLLPEIDELTEVVAAEMNSKALDFYFKHITTVKAGGFYEYRAQYLEELPCVTEGPQTSFDAIRAKTGNIVDIIDLNNKTDRFPEAYLGAYDGELDYIDYEWQTRRYPVNATIQELANGRLAVTAGRSDELTHPLLDRGTREENELRARYVHAAVDGRNVKRGEETTIPMPSRREGVEELMAALESDEATVAETSIEELEADIDAAVYDLFELTDEERTVIEDYLDVF
jgi:hypothetical protein